MRIKSLVLVFCLILVIFTSSCNGNFTKGKLSEVDFSKEVKINVEYNFEVFDALINYQNGCLYFKYCENCGTMSGTEVTINSNEYKIRSNESEVKGVISELNDNFLPLIIYKMLSESGGVIKTQTYDERKECYYFEESILTKFIRFEIYENNGKSSYNLIIT